jgi:hypothetical protein
MGHKRATGSPSSFRIRSLGAAVVLVALVVIVVVRLVVIARQEPIPSASRCSRE